MAADVMVMEKGTAVQPLCMWTSSIDKLFYIEQQLCAAKVSHIGQSWTEAAKHSKLTWDKMDLQHHLSSTAMLSRQHIEIYKSKLVDARDLSNHQNKMQRRSHWNYWVNGLTNRQTDKSSHRSNYCWGGDLICELRIQNRLHSLLVNSGVFHTPM